MEPRPRGFSFGDIDAARAAFCEATGLNMDWGDHAPDAD